MSDFNETDLRNLGAMPPKDFHEAIERIREIADYDLEIPAGFAADLENAIQELVVPDDVLRAIAAAIKVGHVVLQGPPGTGKSSLIRAIAKAYNVSTYAVTAHEDWTIYDVIGRLELRLTQEQKEEIVPVNGALTEAVVLCSNNVVEHFDDPVKPQATWLMIDELNRAHLDKAFGELFSVLGTDELVPINLPHQKEGNRELVIPRRFRIVATLNSYDKQFVQSLSQAIRRRFTFISLEVPPKRKAGTNWIYDLTNPEPAIREFSYVIRRVASRIGRRERSTYSGEIEALVHELISLQTESYLDSISRLFEFAEKVRYASGDSEMPHLPIGTAQLVDTVELFLTRCRQDGGGVGDHGRFIDWAASVKLAPLFESDVLGPEQLTALAQSLSAPFDRALKRELLVIAASGMHFVPEA